MVKRKTQERLACSRLRASYFRLACFIFVTSLPSESLAQARERSEIYQTQGSYPYQGNASVLANAFVKSRTLPLPFWQKQVTIIQRLSIMFTSNSKREFVPRDQVSPLRVTVHYFYT